MATVVDPRDLPDDALPLDKAAARALLKRHKHVGLTIESLELPAREAWGTSARAYCLTKPRLSFDPAHPADSAHAKMRREAVTIVFEHDGHGLLVQRLIGWRVRREWTRSGG